MVSTTPVQDPSPTAFAGDSLLSAVKRLFLATRPMFLPASVLPVVLGAAWGARGETALDAWAFVLAILATLCVHAGANVVNDVYDDLGGTDRINTARIYPYTGGSRFIQLGIMTAAGMARWGIALLVLAAVFGGLLYAMKGFGVILFGLVGITLGLLYSAPPARLSARGLGEASVGLAFGVLPVLGSAWLHSATLDPGALLLALPVALWVANILLVNEIPDIAADAATGKRTLAVRLGPAGTRHLYLGLNGIAAAGVVAAVLADLLPPGSMLVLLMLGPAALLAARGLTIGASPSTLIPSIKLTLAIHAAGTLWLAGWAWLA